MHCAERGGSQYTTLALLLQRLQRNEYLHHVQSLLPASNPRSAFFLQKKVLQRLPPPPLLLYFLRNSAYLAVGSNGAEEGGNGGGAIGRIDKVGGGTFFGSFCWDCEKKELFCACTMPRLISTPPSRAESSQERLRRCRCDEEEPLSFILSSFRHCVVLSLYDGDLQRKKREEDRAGPNLLWRLRKSGSKCPPSLDTTPDGGWKILLQLQTVENFLPRPVAAVIRPRQIFELRFKRKSRKRSPLEEEERRKTMMTLLCWTVLTGRMVMRRRRGGRGCYHHRIILQFSFLPLPLYPEFVKKEREEVMRTIV